MKALAKPLTKNLSVLKELAGNGAGSGNNILFAHKKNILKRYALTRKMKCDQTRIAQLVPAIPIALKNNLDTFFESKRKCLSYISHIRNEASPDVCPMCGSNTSSSTVDHVLPRAMYAELTLFSLNLVPACVCNSKRLFDPNHSPIHPYFDSQLLLSRIVTTNFSGTFDGPQIDVVPAPALQPVQHDRVASHIRCVLLRTNILNFLSKRWGRLVYDPALLLRIPAHASSVDVTNSLIRYRDDAENQTQTPNNWNSMFYDGMLRNPRVIRGIVQLLSGTPLELVPAI